MGTASLFDTLPMTEGQRRAIEWKAKKRKRMAQLRREGRHAEADLLHFRDSHKLPDSIKQAYIGAEIVRKAAKTPSFSE